MSKRRIGILTGGGDVPGLNSVIKSVVYRGREHGLEVVGIRRGFEGLTHVDLDDPASRARYIVDARPGEHPDHRPLRRHHPPHQPRRADQGPRPAAPPPGHGPSPPRPAPPGDHLRPHRPGAREPRAARHRLAPLHRRRRHADLGGPAGAPRGAGHRHPQDHGQRRAGHRVLRRVLHRHHPGHRRDRAAAHHHRLPRAHRHLPGLRARRRLHRPLHRPHHLQPLRHPRVPGRPREAHRPAGDREAPEPLRLRHRHPLRGGHLARLPGAGVRPGRHLRAAQEGQRGRGAERRHPRPDQRGDGGLGPHLRPALRRSRTSSTSWWPPPTAPWRSTPSWTAPAAS